MLPITVEDYLPSPALDEELATRGSAAIHGWPDQAPVDASLARAMLRPAGMTATTLALSRGPDERLLGGAAVRWPATLDAAGRLWGPIVHPAARRQGLGRRLMETVTEILAAHPGVLVSTTPIPESRKEGWALFEAAGWTRAGVSELYERPLGLLETTAGPRAETGGVAVRSVTPGEYIAPALADLVAACRPELGPTIARDTFDRWTRDSRYVPEGLLLADGPERLTGAAIVYPSHSDHADEAAEALIVDVLVAPDLDPGTAGAVRRGLVEAAVRAGTEAGAVVARAIVDRPDLADALAAAGFDVADRVRRYTRHGARG